MEILTNKVLKIAIQGYEGSFHEMAARKYYGKHLNIVPSDSFTHMISNTLNEQLCDEGVMAIENSIAGSILSNYSLLEESDLTITGEVYLEIGQHLMALPGQSIQDISEVHSHPMAILQCRKFFKHLPHIKLIETEDTAKSAQHIQKNQLYGVAAIASKLAAELFQLEIMAHNIENATKNYTRFLVLSRNEDVQTGNKASLHFKVTHEPGSLVKAMQTLSDEGINISKIQSIPIIESDWQYSFHVDIEFDNTNQYKKAIKGLQTNCQELKVLGVYKNGRK